MSDGWVQMEKCAECGRFPIVLPLGRGKRTIACDHGVQQVGVKGHSTTEEWNAAQLRTREPDSA